MKQFTLPFFLLITVLACKPSNSSNTTSEDANKSVKHMPSSDTTSVTFSETKKDTLQVTPEEEKSSATPSNNKKPQSKATPKVCLPNFTKLSSPARSHHVFYVTDFDPGEFKCWIELEAQGTKVCAGTSCVVYFVDSPKVKIDASLPQYMSPETLKSNGIGRFEYNGKYWEIKGASLWKRVGNGYGYYNTDNQLGG